MNEQIVIEPGAAALLRQLHQAGYSAYVVGGCVRDALLGREPNDWDICTSATPDQVLALFGAQSCILTGLKHGTVTVRRGEQNYEVTTFRTEGAYSDGRHPDSVAFVADVRQDLARRDFTINAMAYNEDEGLIDPFGGLYDLRDRRAVRAVGNASARFEEDALRILRMLRFAAQLRFTIDRETYVSALMHRKRLAHVSMERQREELTKLLCAERPSPWIDPEILDETIPEFAPCMGFSQMNASHRWDLWGHLMRTVDNVPAEPALRFAALLHDIAKPACYTPGSTQPFYGHAAASAEAARTIMRRLKASNELTDTVCLLIEYHTMTLPEQPDALRREAKRYLNQIGPENLRRLVALRCADCAAHGDVTGRMLRQAATAQQLLGEAEEILRSGACYHTRQLAVTGRDLIDALGLTPGRAVGVLLDALLEEVLEERLPNERDALLAEAERLHRLDAPQGRNKL
jgi:tRNA nucleotidyltransferase (CCA-adding enzyme)